MKEVSREDFIRWGRQGGKKTKKLYPDHFKEMNKKSQEVKKLKVKHESVETKFESDLKNNKK